MSRSKRIKRIVDLADTATRSASQRLVGSRRVRDEHRDRLEQFVRYREEYVSHLAAGGAAMSASRARELRQFIGQIESAITALESQAQTAERQFSDDQVCWSRESNRTRALSQVHERARQVDANRRDCAAHNEIDDRYAGLGVKEPVNKS